MLRGAYTAERAAALSGVPMRTVHDWARKEILVPSISPTRIKLWSYSDLMGLRTIYWLRRTKQTDSGSDIPATSMAAVRRARAELRALDLDLWNEDGGPSVRVDAAGKVVIVSGGRAEAERQQVMADTLDLIAPFQTTEGLRGPDLIAPRPRLRIVPGKLGGSPHVQRSRVETRALAALVGRGMSRGNVVQLYPALDPGAINEAIELEEQLAQNLTAAAA
jgi:uncharacterized protein (DUF433 family)